MAYIVPIGYDQGMATRDGDIRALRARLDSEQQRADATRAELRVLIVDAMARGVQQAELVRETGYTREYLRRLARAAAEHAAEAQN